MSDYLLEVKNLIAEETGADYEDIVPDASLEDDLDIGELELIELLTELEEMYETDLAEHKEKVETVQDIIDLLNEKL